MIGAGGPASNTKTRTQGTSERRAATADPAVPPPTGIKFSFNLF